MKLAKRLEVLKQLREWLLTEDVDWKQVSKQAYEANKWFTKEFVKHRIDCLVNQYLDTEKLELWVKHYHIDDNITPKKVGIVLAGNIPLVGFHDFLCAFIAGHHVTLKLSEKDQVLFQKILNKLAFFDPDFHKVVTTSEMLKGCDAYIATGSNNTSRYFEYYFGKYPSIIRKNRTSVAVLTGSESEEDLKLLADDIFLYFGLGCRNVTQIYVPAGYDFARLLDAFKKYEHLKDHVKFRNNYDYNLALLIMNNRQYMCNDCIVLVEGNHLFSPVSELYYSYYNSPNEMLSGLGLEKNELVQCIVGKGYVEFGKAQDTSLFDYADGVDTMQFLLSF